MKNINIEVDDFLYKELENFSYHNKKNFSKLVLECLTKGFCLIQTQSEEKLTEQELEKWKTERGFGRHGKLRTLSRIVR